MSQALLDGDPREPILPVTMKPREASQARTTAEAFLKEYGAELGDRSAPANSPGLLLGLAKLEEKGSKFVLPHRVRHEVAKLPERAAVLVSGFPLAKEEQRPTPPSWRHDTGRFTAFDVYLWMLNAVNGRLVTTPSQQDGRPVTLMRPREQEATEETAQGKALKFHTEDSWFDLSPDEIVLGLVRRAPVTRHWMGKGRTLLIDPSMIDLSGPPYAPLFEKRYIIKPDPEHRRNMRAAGVAYRPQRVALARRVGGKVEVRIDVPFTRAADRDDKAAEHALALWTTELGRLPHLSADMGPGDALIVNNNGALHGREPFEAHFDHGSFPAEQDRCMLRLIGVEERKFVRSAPFRDGRVIDPIAAMAGTGR